MAANAYAWTYRGTIGKQPLVMYFEIRACQSDDDEPAVFYMSKFFIDPAQPEQMFGGMVDEDQTMTLKPLMEPDAESSFVFSGMTVGDRYELPTELHGKWIAANGKHQPVHLQQVNPKQLPPTDADNPFMTDSYRNKPYEYLRLQQLKLQPAEQQTFQGYHLQWFEEPSTGLRMLQILDGYPPQVLQQLNQLLRERFGRDSQYYFGHKSLLPIAEVKKELKPHYLSANVISLTSVSSVSVPGIQGHQIIHAMNWAIVDNQVREHLWLTDILWLGDENPLSAEQDSEAYFLQYGHSDEKEAIQKQQIKWLVQQLNRLYPQQMQAADKDCISPQVEDWNHVTWYLTEKGIQLLASDMIKPSCQIPEWAVLPYAEIAKHPSWFKPAIQ